MSVIKCAANMMFYSIPPLSQIFLRHQCGSKNLDSLTRGIRTQGDGNLRLMVREGGQEREGPVGGLVEDGSGGGADMEGRGGNGR